jgi:hypothetical protein
MKKIGLLLLLSISFVGLKAQQGVVFKVKYLPNHTYKIGFKLGVKLNATLAGDQNIIDQLNSNGLTQPVTVNADVTMGGDTKTGAVVSDQSFPLDMNLMVKNISVQANGKDAPIPPKVTETNLKISGHVTPDGQIKLDSAMGKKITDSAQRKMQQMMSVFQKQIKFPEKALKPGDSFTEGAPITNMPVKGNSNMTMDAKVTYKLISIADGKAYFDMSPVFNMEFSIKNTSVNITGTGTGKMVYSIKDNFPLSKDGTFDLKIKVTSEKINANATALITTNYTSTIN